MPDAGASAGYTPTGYFPDELPGTMVGDLRNEDLERLTIPSESVDLWIHLDVLEHLFQPFKALKEISRTLKAGALCIFAAPTYAGKARSERAASLNEEGKPEVVGKPEYHGNPQRPNDGSLVTWRYGYDLSLRISRETDFDVEVRRWQSRESAVMGPMTEIYICRKRA